MQRILDKNLEASESARPRSTIAAETIDRIVFPEPRDTMDTCGKLFRSDLPALAGCEVTAECGDGIVRHGEIAGFDYGELRMASVAVRGNSVYQVKVDFGNGKSEWVGMEKVLDCGERNALRR